jgi:hypothetical protein
MAEPILGQALALQSEFRPDTTQVLTRAVDKIGNVTLKKQLAEAKAQEAQAKRLQEIMGAVKLDGAKVNRHFLPEATKKYAEGIASLQESALKGDIMGVNAKKGQLEMEFDNIAKQSDAMDNFLSLKKQGFYIAPEIETAFSMPKAEGQAYLKKVYELKPELKGIVDVNEYGDYVFNPIKDLDLQADFRDVVTKNELLFKPTGQRATNTETKDQLELYKIPKTNIQEFALLKSQDPEIKANIILKDKAGFSAYVNQVKTANPNATPEQVENTALSAYIYDKLEKINEKTVKSNIPQKGSGLDFNFGGGGGALSFDMDGNPTNGVIPIQVEASTTTPGGRKVTKAFDRGVPTGNNFSFNTVEVLNTRGENVIDMETNMPLEAKMLQSTKVGDVVAVPIASKDFVGSNGVNYKKGQMVDGKVLKTAIEKGLASYEPRVKGIASYTGKLNGEDRVVQKSVLIPAGSVRTGVISSQSGKNQEFINSLFDKAIKEADELNARGRRGAKTSTPQPKTITPTSKVKVDLSSFDKTSK